MCISPVDEQYIDPAELFGNAAEEGENAKTPKPTESLARLATIQRTRTFLLTSLLGDAVGFNSPFGGRTADVRGTLTPL
jgi:hypothetical protein